jgi:branched-chain amino acid transport system permease protein
LGDLTGAAVVAVIGLGAFFAFPTDLALLTRMIALAFLVVSLQLVVGVCGVLTLGHAALWGVAGYAAGIACLAGLRDPLLLIVVGSAAGALMGLITGALILRASGLAQLVMSIATVQVRARDRQPLSRRARAAATALPASIRPPSWAFSRFDLSGQGGLSVLAGAPRAHAVPLAAPCRIAFRTDMSRPAASIPCGCGRLASRPGPAPLRMYVVAGAVAGVGGALSAMTAGVVALDSVSFERSASALCRACSGGPAPRWRRCRNGGVCRAGACLVRPGALSLACDAGGVLLIAIALTVPDGLATLPRWLRQQRERP